MTLDRVRVLGWARALLLFGVQLCFCLAPCPAQTSAAGPSAAAKESSAEFVAAAYEVLQEMSEITGLRLRGPLKKTLRSRDDIRAYLIRQMDDDKNPQERYADARAAEAFGLLPQKFDLDPFLVDLMTEQIAGLYDPKAREFYIADWIPLAAQKPVMAHELTHALQDQYFHIEEWSKAVHTNGDATLARDAVLEGSAMAAMVDYTLRDTGHSLKDLPGFDPSMMMGDLASSPKLEQAPPFIKDTLMFPYLSGLSFTASAIRNVGWSALANIFAKPPLSTQQILHPALYKSGKVPRRVSVPSFEKPLGADWVKLEDDTMGELVPPGSVVVIDKASHAVEMSEWKSIRERPIYFVWHEKGYSCAWCNVVHDNLFVVPYPTSRKAVMIFKMPRAATIIGRIVHVWSPLLMIGAPSLG